MGSGHILPLVIVVGILAVTAVAALIATFVRERKLFAGYEEIQADIAMLKSKLGAEVFRDGDDLVVSGQEMKLPVVVRFSYSETTPGLNIRVHGPAALNLAIIPKGSQFIFPENLRLNLNTPDDMFNARFITRADDGAAARMFLMSRATMKEIQKALCSSRTTLSIAHGSLELSETIVPQPYTGSHVSGHIESLLRMSIVLAKMPGAQLSVVEKPKLPKRLLTKTAIAFGAAAALVSILGAAQQLKEPKPIVRAAGDLGVDERGMGVQAKDRELINGLESYRVVKSGEMNSGIVDWMHSKGVEANGAVALDLFDSGSTDDQAYLLVNPEGTRRLVIVSKGRVIFDGKGFGQVAIVRVKKINMPAKTAAARGDGILLVQDVNATDKAFLLYVGTGGVISQAEPNFLQFEISE